MEDMIIFISKVSVANIFCSLLLCILAINYYWFIWIVLDNEEVNRKYINHIKFSVILLAIAVFSSGILYRSLIDAKDILLSDFKCKVAIVNCIWIAVDYLIFFGKSLDKKEKIIIKDGRKKLIRSFLWASALCLLFVIFICVTDTIVTTVMAVLVVPIYNKYINMENNLDKEKKYDVIFYPSIISLIISSGLTKFVFSIENIITLNYVIKLGTNKFVLMISVFCILFSGISLIIGLFLEKYVYKIKYNN
ncbi:MFS family permease [Bacilli bacterium PM5-3]|nr:MFS family permease [Bacilli bacterium PM5-3]MDH6604082.1 MFS family permease [Bacilli bacterium PM5-9]